MKRRTITKEELDEFLRKHKLWLENKEGGERLVLNGYDLSRSDLSGSDLSGANLDYSVIPLWCGSLKANFDDRQLTQIAYHLVKAGLNSNNASDEIKAELEKLIDLANKFHRVSECGKIEKTNGD